MFDIAWSELILIGAVALVAIPPKDLPGAMRTFGQTVGKIRRMAGEFQSQFNDAMREAELHDLKKQVEEVGGSVQSAMNPDFKPIDQINDFGAPKPAQDDPAENDEAARREAEAKLAALPGPEPLPEIVIDPAPVAEPAPEPEPEPEVKPKAPRKRTAKAKAAEVTEPGEGSPA
ncbi:Sec-independent protein translocase protein TatB [Bosea sp. BK604]|uniref:Sec-independent protein translocase protein TatB n=1 Tax=Bosea sp. BK604 TaxID=2512180 RepID=UPI0010DAE2B9|nr:Sec-independent protein translocase protein TatB [Bosea sp. BK604]TCR62156.1 sec-independent protein translocase protein TatB [Bosea sp. BK604]